MDRRLSGALAWSALIIVLVIPGAEIASRQLTASASAGSTSAATGQDLAALSWNSTPPKAGGELLGPPAPEPLATPEPTAEARGSETAPEIAIAAEPAAPTPVDPAPYREMLATRQAVAAASSGTQRFAVEPLPDRIIPMSPSAATAPETAVAAIPSAAPAVAGSALATAEPAAPIAVATADTAAPISASAPPQIESLPEIIPYPAPASQRPHAPVVVAVARPKEPVPHNRPDNAIFFPDWSLVPPMPIGAAPRR